MNFGISIIIVVVVSMGILTGVPDHHGWIIVIMLDCLAGGHLKKKQPSGIFCFLFVCFFIDYLQLILKDKGDDFG